MLRIVLVLSLVIGLSAGFIAADSLAVFTDQEVNAANTFTTGTVLIDDSPASALVTFSTMAPGDTTIQQLTLTNSGSLALRYAMTTAATNTDTKALRDELLLTVRTKTANPCSSEDGTVLFAAAALSAGALGNPAQGSQAGDRTLAAAATDELCFKVNLPTTSGNTFQNATTTATFTFDSEQTVNNP